eukprot:m51a1_g1852 hypothetical protein (447) ;mRNA; r:598601-600169
MATVSPHRLELGVVSADSALSTRPPRFAPVARNVLAFAAAFGAFGAAVSVLVIAPYTMWRERMLSSAGALLPLSLSSVLSCTALPAVFALGMWGPRALGAAHAAGLAALLGAEAAWGVWDNVCRRETGAAVSLSSLGIEYAFGLAGFAWTTFWAGRRLRAPRNIVLHFTLPLLYLLVFMFANDMTFACAALPATSRLGLISPSPNEKKWYANTDSKLLRMLLRGVVGVIFWLLAFICREQVLPLTFAGAHMLMTFWATVLTFGIESWALVAPVSVLSAVLNVVMHECWWQSTRVQKYLPAWFPRLAPKFGSRYYALCLHFEAVSRIGTLFGAAGLYGAAQYVNHLRGVVTDVPGGRLAWVLGVLAFLLALELLQFFLVFPRSSWFGIPTFEVTVGLFRRPLADVVRILAVVLIIWYCIMLFAAARLPWSFIVEPGSLDGDSSSSLT